MNYIKPNWPAPACIKAYTTLKSLSPPLEKGGKDAQQLKTLLHLPEEPIWVKQTHSAIALEAIPENREQIADATFTTQPNRVCAVLTADCLPLLVCNTEGTQIAAIHAGWRGLASGIIEVTLKNLPHRTSDLLVWLGPAIGPQKFEVGKDVYDAFTLKQPTSASAFIALGKNKWLANLYTLAKIRLQNEGIAHIYGGDFCTYTQENLFFSYRRDKGTTGRMASLIWIEGN